MRNSFPLFQSHLDLAHTYWSQILNFGDIAIDATCGNGHDALKLCQLTLTRDTGKIYAFDIQPQAILSSRQLLENSLAPDLYTRVNFDQRCHSSFPPELLPSSVKLIVYNLGYLPGGDKKITTQTSVTLQSLVYATELLQKGGVISVTCYPGHPEGFKEQEAILSFASRLPPDIWSCCHHHWLNRNQSPSLLLLQKNH